MKRTKLIAYVDRVSGSELLNTGSTIARIYTIYMKDKEYIRELFWDWASKLTPEDLEDEFNPHEIMELFSSEVPTHIELQITDDNSHLGAL